MWRWRPPSGIFRSHLLSRPTTTHKGGRPTGKGVFGSPILNPQVFLYTSTSLSPCFVSPTVNRWRQIMALDAHQTRTLIKQQRFSSAFIKAIQTKEKSPCRQRPIRFVLTQNFDIFKTLTLEAMVIFSGQSPRRFSRTDVASKIRNYFSWPKTSRPLL